MPTKIGESPPRQEVGEGNPDGGRRAEVRNSAPIGGGAGRNHDAPPDADVQLVDDPGINTHGSER